MRDKINGLPDQPTHPCFTEGRAGTYGMAPEMGELPIVAVRLREYREKVERQIRELDGLDKAHNAAVEASVKHCPLIRGLVEGCVVGAEFRVRERRYHLEQAVKLLLQAEWTLEGILRQRESIVEASRRKKED